MPIRIRYPRRGQRGLERVRFDALGVPAKGPAKGPANRSLTDALTDASRQAGVSNIQALRQALFSREIPVTELWRTYYGRQVDLNRIEQAIRGAEVGMMRPLTDLTREMIDRDPTLGNLVQKRFRSLAALDWDVLPAVGPGIDNERAGEMAGVVRDQIGRIPNLRKRIFQLAWGFCDGRSANELFWKGPMYGSVRWQLTGMGWIHPRRIAFGPEREFRIVDGLYSTSYFPAIGEALRDWPHKFVQLQAQLFGEYPEREGLGPRSLYWAFFKRFGQRERLILAELFGKPWRIIEADKDALTVGGDKEDVAAADEQIAALGGANIARLPRGMHLNVVQPQGDVGGRTHKEIITDANEELEKLWVGQTSTSESRPQGLNSKQSETHKDEQNLILQGDSWDISEAIEDGIVDSICVLNWGEESLSHAPSFMLKADPAADRTVEIDRLGKAVASGLPIALEEAYEVAGYRPPRADEARLELSAAPGETSPRALVVYPSGAAPTVGQTSGTPTSPTASGMAPPPAEPSSAITQMRRILAEQGRDELGRFGEGDGGSGDGAGDSARADSARVEKERTRAKGAHEKAQWHTQQAEQAKAALQHDVAALQQSHADRAASVKTISSDLRTLAEDARSQAAQFKSAKDAKAAREATAFSKRLEKNADALEKLPLPSADKHLEAVLKNDEEAKIHGEVEKYDTKVGSLMTAGEEYFMFRADPHLPDGRVPAHINEAGQRFYDLPGPSHFAKIEAATESQSDDRGREVTKAISERIPEAARSIASHEKKAAKWVQHAQRFESSVQRRSTLTRSAVLSLEPSSAITQMRRILAEQGRDELGRFGEGDGGSGDGGSSSGAKSHGSERRATAEKNKADIAEEHAATKAEAEHHAKREQEAHAYATGKGGVEIQRAQVAVKELVQKYAAHAKASGHDDHAEALEEVASAMQPARLAKAIERHVATYEKVRAMPEGSSKEQEAKEAAADKVEDNGKVYRALGVEDAKAAIDRYLVDRNAPPMSPLPEGTGWASDANYARERNAEADRRRSFGLKPGQHPELEHAEHAAVGHVDAMLSSLEAHGLAQQASARAERLGRALQTWEKRAARSAVLSLPYLDDGELEAHYKTPTAFRVNRQALERAGILFGYDAHLHLAAQPDTVHGSPEAIINRGIDEVVVHTGELAAAIVEAVGEAPDPKAPPVMPRGPSRPST